MRFRDLFERRRFGDAGIDKQDVETAKHLLDRCGHPRRVGRYRLIGKNGDDVRAERSGAGAQAFRVLAGDSHARAVAKPMPLVPPVMRAVLLFSRVMGISPKGKS